MAGENSRVNVTYVKINEISMIEEAAILRIAQSLKKPLLYRDFYSLRPNNTVNYHWLFRIKNVLKKNGYICHERGKRSSWGSCGYTGSYTHFH